MKIRDNKQESEKAIFKEGPNPALPIEPLEKPSAQKMRNSLTRRMLENSVSDALSKARLKLKSKRKGRERLEFLKLVRPVITDRSTGNLKINPYIEDTILSPIEIMFSNERSYGINLDTLLSPDADPPKDWSLVDNLDENNRMTIRINLNQGRGKLIDEFSRLLSLINRAMKKRKIRFRKISFREYENYLRAYNLKAEGGLSFEDVARELFPQDFKLTRAGGKIESAIKKAQRFFKEAAKMIEGN